MLLALLALALVASVLALPSLVEPWARAGASAAPVSACARRAASGTSSTTRA